MPTDLDETLATVRLVDHHVHGPLALEVDRDGFESLISESDRPQPPGLTAFDSQLGFAVRRHCAPLLGLPERVAADDYWDARATWSPGELARLFLGAAGVGDWVVDTGFSADDIWGVERMEAELDGRSREIVRLESTLEDVALTCEPEELEQRFREALDEAARTAVGWKSIVAYRYGFDFEPTRPTSAEVKAAARAWMTTFESGARPRVEDPVLLRFLLFAACDTGMPLQLHVGFGDPDLDMHRCNPALLTEWLRTVEPTGVRVMLLHCYPYHRMAGYLAHVFPHVYMDVGLGINYTGAASSRVIAESMELAPFGKLLYSSDAWGPPELHYLGSVLWRRGTAAVLRQWVEDGEWSASDACRVAEMVARDNARRVYGLDA